MTLSRLLLIVAALGLVPIALSYGLVPEISMSLLYGIEVDGTSLTHILRAVMGLYLALATLWIFGAVIPELERPALISLVVFVLSLFWLFNDPKRQTVYDRIAKTMVIQTK